MSPRNQQGTFKENHEKEENSKFVNSKEDSIKSCEEMCGVGEEMEERMSYILTIPVLPLKLKIPHSVHLHLLASFVVVLDSFLLHPTI